MTIEEMEPKVIEKGLNPKHLIFAKGKNVKWLVCVKDVGYGNKIVVVFDAKGNAYKSYSQPIGERFFEEAEVIAKPREGILLVNKIFCEKEDILSINRP
jgi:hypothetical protein